MADDKQFEDSLVRILTKNGLDKDRLRMASSTIVNLKKAGLGIDQVYTKGKPAFDKVIINGIVDPDFWRKFASIGEYGFEHFEVFPYGVIASEGFRFQITL